MEREDDVLLIHAVLRGDDVAFNTLVEKYQKSVHALAWRKIGDFHYAEEITQDTFIQAYKKLSTLRNPHHFAGWLYVIANRLCINWFRRKKPSMQSLEETPMEIVEKSAYAHYLLEKQESEATERRYEIVKRLIEKLPESERTVVTLHYLGEMTTKEISKFLGVSANTIRTRLHRARKRLQADEELAVQEVLGGVQIPARIGENIMQHVADLKPISSPASKPMLPWVAFGTAVTLVILSLAAGNRYLTRFQKAYSFEAASEPTVEIIDTPIILDIDDKSDHRNQMGWAASSDKSIAVNSHSSEMTVGTTAGQDFTAFQKQVPLITIERAITWMHVGDKSKPSQMALVRTEFDKEITYGLIEYTGHQTVQTLMDTFDQAYDRQHTRTIVTVFSKASIAEINSDEIIGIDAWTALLSKEGVFSQFTLAVIDARYPRAAWLQYLLERGVIIESLIDYFFCMTHRYQLAFFEDSPYLWETEIHGVSSTDILETYKAIYTDGLVKYYTQNWKSTIESLRKQMEITKGQIVLSNTSINIDSDQEASENNN